MGCNCLEVTPPAWQCMPAAAHDGAALLTGTQGRAGSSQLLAPPLPWVAGAPGRPDGAEQRGGQVSAMLHPLLGIAGGNRGPVVEAGREGSCWVPTPDLPALSDLMLARPFCCRFAVLGSTGNHYTVGLPTRVVGAVHCSRRRPPSRPRLCGGWLGFHSAPPCNRLAGHAGGRQAHVHVPRLPVSVR